MKRNSFIIISILLSSLIVSTVMELFIYNRNVLKRSNNYSAEIISMKDIENNNGWYETTSNKSYIIINVTSPDKYINKLNFNYKYYKDFNWEIITDHNEIIKEKSTDIINDSIKELKLYSSTLKIKFNNKNIKFKDIIINNKIYINYSRIVIVSLILFGICIILFYKQYFLNNLEKSFLFIIIIGGITIFITTPKIIGASYDDNTHLKNSIVFLKENNIKVNDAYVINELKANSFLNTISTIEEQTKLYSKLNNIYSKSNVTLQINNKGAKYNKLIYLPFNLGINISKILNLNYIATLLLARILNFICYVVILYFAVKISTSAKKLIFVISTMQAPLFYATQFSYDPIIVSSFILAFAIFLRLLEMNKINKKYILSFIILVIIASLSKAIYAPFLLLLLFVPNNKFDNKKQAISIKIISMIIMLLLISTFLLPNITGIINLPDLRGGNVNVALQMKYIIHNPILFLKNLLKFIIENMPFPYFDATAYITACWMDSKIKIRGLLYMTNIILLLYIVFNDNNLAKIINKKEKCLFFTMVTGFTLLIYATMYLAYTDVGSEIVKGLHARYFYPIIIPFYLLFTKTYMKQNAESIKNYNKNILIVIIPFLLIVATSYSFIYNGIGF